MPIAQDVLLEELQKLASMRDSGALSDVDFDRQAAALLTGPSSHPIGSSRSAPDLRDDPMAAAAWTAVPDTDTSSAAETTYPVAPTATRHTNTEAPLRGGDLAVSSSWVATPDVSPIVPDPDLVPPEVKPKHRLPHEPDAPSLEPTSSAADEAVATPTDTRAESAGVVSRRRATRGGRGRHLRTRAKRAADQWRTTPAASNDDEDPPESDLPTTATSWSYWNRTASALPEPASVDDDEPDVASLNSWDLDERVRPPGQEDSEGAWPSMRPGGYWNRPGGSPLP